MLNARPWVPQGQEHPIQTLAQRFAGQTPAQNERDVLAFVEENRFIQERDCFDLNPATNQLVRWGMASRRMPRLAGWIADVLRGRRAPEAVAPEVTAYRRDFPKLHDVR